MYILYICICEYIHTPNTWQENVLETGDTVFLGKMAGDGRENPLLYILVLFEFLE